MTTPTPATWKKEGATILQDITNREVCKMLGKNEEIQNANARLISAAPDLLQVARDYVLLCQLHGMEGAVLDSALSAIAKAEGEA
jgi:hypothetical protein